MKKVLIFLMILPNMVFAQTIYTDYQNYLINSVEYLEESDLIKRSEFKIYNTYIEEIEEKYAKLGELINYEIDYNNFYLNKEYSLSKTEFSKNYELKCLNDNNRFLDITLENFSDNIKINEIEVIFHQEIKPYGTMFTDYNGSSKYVFDKKIDDNSVEFRKIIGKMYLSLLDYSTMDNISLKLSFPKQDVSTISFNLKFGNELAMPIILYLEENENTIITLNFDKNYNEFLLLNNFFTTDKCIPVYENDVPFYKHTKINKIIQNKYRELDNINNFLLDDYQIRYNYQKRDKLEIKDEFYLKDTIFDINDFLISSTIPTDELLVINNINYKESGTYLISIYYHNQLLLEKNLIYENTNQYLANLEVLDNMPKKLENRTLTTTKKISRVTKNKTTTKQQTYKGNEQKTKMTTYNINNLKLTKNQEIRSNKQTKFYIFIVSILIISLTILEIILLYVKRKYF